MLGRIARWTGLAALVQETLRREMRDAMKALTEDVKSVERQVSQLDTRLKDLAEQSVRAEQVAMQVKYTLRLNESHAEELSRLDTLLDEERVTAHVRKAIAAAPLHTDPFPHVVVERLFPVDLYKVLLKSIPPAVFFSDRDLLKQNLRTPMEFGPELSVRAMAFLEEVVARRAIRPAILEKFHEHLQHHYDTIFGPEFRERASQLPQAVSGGRVMLRRPGYHLSAHRDPKRAMVTCLLYLARSSDSETYGTHIYRVRGDGEAGYTRTYYPEQDGRTCELVKMVPYRPNTMLAFVNSGGAHGATIPKDAPPDLERFAYQFYLGPEGDALEELIHDLPPERQAMWRK
jgi:hypothetical protein